VLQPTPDQIARVRHAQQIEKAAHATLAQAQYEHTVAQQDLSQAIEALLLNSTHVGVTGASRNPHTPDEPRPHPTP
jgi:hypothetical protein